MNNDQGTQQHDDGLPDDFEMGPLTDQEKQMAQYELEQKMLDALQDGPSTGHYEPTAEELEEVDARAKDWQHNQDKAPEGDPEPTQEEIDQMAEESAILRAERRNPFRCEDDLPAPVFATVQAALAGRSTLGAIEQLALIKALQTHGITLKRLEYPHPTAPYFLLWLVSTHLRPTSGWYVY